MFTSKIKILRSHGIQYIKELDKVVLTEKFRGRPIVSGNPSANVIAELSALCPSGAIAGTGTGAGRGMGTGTGMGTAAVVAAAAAADLETVNRLSIDLGRCVFCKECALRYPDHIRFTNDYHMATNDRQRLIVDSSSPDEITLDSAKIRKEITSYFGHALKLRQVSAGGDNSTEMELNASMNVNFDLGRYGIDFVASPRHADGIVVTGPVTENMAIPLELCYNAIAHPTLVILAGTDAISGGLFAGSDAVDRTFLDRIGVDLYVPGNPVHPLTFIHGVLSLIRPHK